MCRRGLGTAIVLGLVLVTGAIREWRSRPSVQDGAALLARGEAAAAVRALVPAVTAAPTDARAHYYLGLAYARTGARDGAVNHLEEAVRLAPADPRFHAGLGQVYREAGNTERALTELETAARDDAGEPEYQVDLGSVLLAEGRTMEAIEHLRRAIELAPRAAGARLVFADALGRAGDREGMIAQYRDAERLAGDGATAELARRALRAAERAGDCR